MHERKSIQRKKGSGVTDKNAQTAVQTALSASAQPLDSATRAFMEPRFGHDFSQVRVHTDDLAAQSARAVNALAFTSGQDVVFGASQYAPETSGGQRLIAHELVHVVQQESSRMSMRPELGDTGDTYEHEAETVSKSILSDLPAPDMNRASRGYQISEGILPRTTIQRETDNQQGQENNGQNDDNIPESQSDHYVIAVKAWIPHPAVEDPEEPLHDVVDRVAAHDKLDFTTAYTHHSHYRGDDHVDYPGEQRVFSSIAFDWDGRQITGLNHQEVYGKTHRDWWFEEQFSGNQVAEGIDEGQATATTDGGITDPGGSFFVSLTSSNPLTFVPAPPIRSLLTGTFNSDGTMHLVAQTTLFPSHGFRVAKNGSLIAERLTNDANGVQPFGLPGVAEISTRLTNFSNVVADDTARWR